MTSINFRWRSPRALRLVMLVLALGACSKSEGAVTREAPAVPVEIATATVMAAPVELSTNGVVEPMKAVAVEALVNGLMTEVAFREGDAVTKGQVLFRIDPRPFETALRQAQATLARDAALATNARRDAERFRAMVEQDVVTRQQAEEAESNAAARQATLVADSAAVETASLNLGYATITAPISGKTGSLLVREGNVVRPGGSPLVMINQLQPILVRFPVSQKDFAAVRQRSSQGRVSVSVARSDGTRMDDVGALSFIDNAIDSLTGTITAKAQFANNGNHLWPGEYVRVTVHLAVEPDAVVIPTRALMAGQTGTTVFVVDTSNTVTLRTVQAGRPVGDLTTILEGVTSGERVVVNGQSRLATGSRIEIRRAVEQGGGEK